MATLPKASHPTEEKQMSYADSEWYVSLTAIWSDAEGFPDLLERIRASGLIAEHNLPSSFQAMPVSSWHSTIFHFVTACQGTTDAKAQEASVTSVIDERRGTLAALIPSPKPLVVEATEFRIDPEVVAVQFRPLNDTLETLRDGLCDSASEMKLHEVSPHLKPADFSPQSNKNRGNKLYGSIARSRDGKKGRSAGETPALHSPCLLVWNSYHILVSNRWLTNPSSLQNDARITFRVAF
ncbi:MAG: hypothetical protein M3552_02455 [Planctomycetota bacterium]|nr:hypothetical protein [Planctomycetota bacterium]